MENTDPFIKAYHEFKETVDFSKSGILPDLENMIGYLLMGIPRVPADNDTSDESALEAVDQRISILKAVFTELNHDAAEDFLDQGLSIYDEAAKETKKLLKESNSQT
jgi:hypothetical protein